MISQGRHTTHSAHPPQHAKQAWLSVSSLSGVSSSCVAFDSSVDIVLIGSAKLNLYYLRKIYVVCLFLFCLLCELSFYRDHKRLSKGSSGLCTGEVLNIVFKINIDHPQFCVEFSSNKLCCLLKFMLLDSHAC